MQPTAHIERRVTPRLRFARDVTVYSPRHQSITAVCLDISLGGIGLQTSCDLHPGETIVFQTELPVGAKIQPFSAHCYVVSRHAEPHHNHFRIGSQFTRMPRHDRQTLARFVRCFAGAMTMSP